MKNNCAFTICTRSYIGLANTLKYTFLKYNEDFDFYIIFCDGEGNENDGSLSGCDIVGLGKEKYEELAFKYNVTEFCTCIKPFGFTYFFSKGYKTVAYFDPDIMFFSNFDELYEDYSVYLTPHVINPLSKMKNDWGQEQFLKYGVYNCGFVGLKNDNNGKLVASWWCEHLLNKAFADPEGGLYTDQKWMDMVPSFIELGRINIIKNWGCDFAPWNYAERTVEKNGDCFYAVSRDDKTKKNKLVFVHYSAYDYKRLLEEKKIMSKYTLSDYSEMDDLLIEYHKVLQKFDTLKFLSTGYIYNKFENGMPILPFHRRLYRVCLENGRIFQKPFSCEKDSFYSELLKSKLLTKQDKSQIGKASINNFESKNKKIINLYRCIFRILGINRYILFLRKSAQMSRFENNIFLL